MKNVARAHSGRNQLIKLALYGSVLHGFNKGAQTFLDIDANVQIATINNVPECAGMVLLPNQACKVREKFELRSVSLIRARKKKKKKKKNWTRDWPS